MASGEPPGLLLPAPGEPPPPAPPEPAQGPNGALGPLLPPANNLTPGHNPPTNGTNNNNSNSAHLNNNNNSNNNNHNSGNPVLGPPNPRNPLVCQLCQDYFQEPCLLQCFHTFCARCLRGAQTDGKLGCPSCGQPTQLKEGAQLPPADQLIRQLVELANSENPPCANCDKRDKTTMFFCTTCGQALCNHCREHTHRAKMFSTHEVVPMSKCNKEVQRRCPSHGEPYVMFSLAGKCMLCALCLRDTAPDARMHCVEIEQAWQQASKKMERAANALCELQAGVKDGLGTLKSHLDELKHSYEQERRSVGGYCQGIQQAITKTHSNVLAELQRQFENKERTLRNQLLSLASALPVLQLHLMLCTLFTSGTTKYQFLELAHPMLDRLAKVAQLGHLSRPPMLSVNLKINYRNEFIKALQPFITQQQQQQQQQQGHQQQQQHQQQQHHHHQAKDLGGYESDHRHTQSSSKPGSRGGGGGGGGGHPKLFTDSGLFSDHCKTFDYQIGELSQQLTTVKEKLSELHRDVSLLRRANTPPLGMRYEHVSRDCKLLEQQLEYQQTELERLRSVFSGLWEEQLCRIHIEKEVFHAHMNDILVLQGELKQLQATTQQLEPFIKSFAAGVNAGEMSTAASDTQSCLMLQNLLDKIARLQNPEAHAPIKDCRQPRSGPESKEVPTRCRTPSSGIETVLDSSGNIFIYGSAKSTESKKGVLSQLIELARTKEDRKKSPGREQDGAGSRDRSQTRRSSSRKSPENVSGKPKTPPDGGGGGGGGHSAGNKVRSMYRSLKGGGGSGDHPDPRNDLLGLQQTCNHQQKQGGQQVECEYQRISDASSSTLIDAKKRVQAEVHRGAAELERSLQAIKGSAHLHQHHGKLQHHPGPNRERSGSKVYPASDSEDVFYSGGSSGGPRERERAERDRSLEGRRRRRASCDSLSTTGSGNSIIDLALGQDPRKTLVFFVGPPASRPSSTSSLAKKQRSWETFPGPKNKRNISSDSGLAQLKRADSFEGHEKTVTSLVERVVETRLQSRQHHLDHHHHHRYHRKTN